MCDIGVYIKLDYTHIDCLQEDKNASSSAFQKMSSALIQLVKEGHITHDEARYELAKLIDIDPDKPKGDYKTINSANNE